MHSDPTCVAPGVQEINAARAASARTLAECADVSYDGGGLYALLKFLPALHVLDPSGMWNTCGLLAVLAAYLVHCSRRVDEATVEQFKVGLGWNGGW